MEAELAIAATYVVGAGLEARHVRQRFARVDGVTIVAASVAWPFAVLVELVFSRWLAAKERPVAPDELHRAARRGRSRPTVRSTGGPAHVSRSPHGSGRSASRRPASR